MHFPVPFELVVFHEQFRWLLTAGIFVVLLGHIYGVGEFALPTLGRQERKPFLTGMAAAYGVFVAGAIIAYAWILPSVVASSYREAMLTMLLARPEWGHYALFAGELCFGFGLLCELPVIVILLGLLGFVDFRFLSKTRPFGYTIILILAAVIAPTPDPVTFVTLSVPIVLLYEACIWVVWLIGRRRKRREKEEEAKRNLPD